jgi:hypothetical protein
MSTESTEIKLTESESNVALESYKNVTNMEAEPVKKYIDEINKIDEDVNATLDAKLNDEAKKGGKVTKKSKVKSRSRSRSKSKTRSKSKSKSKR